MTYGQENYSQKMGNGNYTIAEIGCFLTAFCNLLQRFGKTVDPPTLNGFFTGHGNYLADPADGAGVKDDLAWSTITAYASDITVASVGVGWPSSNNAIVKFHYQSISHPKLANGQPNMIDHFCLVADAGAHTIVDSYDGKTKQPGEYGDPVAYATYTEAVVQPVVLRPAPAPANTVAPYSVEQIAPKTMIAHANPTHEWDLNFTTWGDISSHPENSLAPGTPVTVVAIAHHKLGSSYYMPDAGQPNGYNVVDLQDAPASAAPTPAPTPPAAPATTIVTVGVGWGLERIAAAAGRSDAAHPNVWQLIATANGSNNWIAFNKSLKPGQKVIVPLQGDHGDGVENPDTEAPVETPAPGTTVSPSASAAPTPPTDPKKDITSYKNTFKEIIGPLVSNNAENVVIKDLDGLLPDQVLKPRSLIAQAGVLWKDGKKFIITIQSYAAGHMYGIPAELASHVSPSQRKAAERVVEDLYDKYMDIEDDLKDAADELFQDGMRFEDDVAADFKNLTSHERHVNTVAKFLRHFSKNK